VPEHLRAQDNDGDDQEQGEQQQDEHGQGEQGDDEENDADSDQDEGDEEGDEEDEDEPREPIDLTVRLVDAAGEVAELALSRFSMVQPQLEVQLRKAFLEAPDSESEAVFQSFLFPLQWFIEANPALDASRPSRLELVFDRTASGVVILDSVGFRPVPGSESPLP
jgi:hypothetical protein